LLGVGMALPWPFAGAGMSLLPRPGAWMRFVKIPFAVLIFLLALYYLKSGGSILLPRDKQSGGSILLPSDDPGSGTLPLLYYFSAKWCKNCVLMERTTFQNQCVREQLENFHFVKIQAEDPKDPETAKWLRKYDVKGLPTFIILEPELGSKMLPLPLFEPDNHGSKMLPLPLEPTP